MGREPEDNHVDSTNSNLEDEVDKLLDEVEALTQEVLADGPQKVETPSSDPARQSIEDDAGLAEESPLVQDGEPTPIDDIVSDVELELDRATQRLEHVMTPEDTAPPESGVLEDDAIADAAEEHATDSDAPGHAVLEHVDPPVEPLTSAGGAGDESSPHPGPALEPDLDAIAELEELERELAAIGGQEPATFQEAATAEAADGHSEQPASEDILDQLEDLTSDVTALSDEVMAYTDSAAAGTLEAPQPPTAQPPKPPDELAADVESELDQLEDLLSELEGKPADMTAQPAAQPPIDLPTETLVTRPSAEEAALDADLEELLAAPDDTAEEETASDGGGVDIDSISVLDLVRRRWSVRRRRVMQRIQTSVQNHLVRFLDLLDRPFGRLPNKTKELVGYCAIATVAMTAVALLLVVVL